MMARMHVEPARARTAAQVLVRAAHGEVRVERGEVERQHPGVVIDVEQHAGAERARLCHGVAQVRQDRAGAKRDARYDQELTALRAERFERQHLEVDAALLAVHAQDEVERIELCVRRQHARPGGERVEHRTQALAGAGLGHDAVPTPCADQLRRQRPPLLARREPQVPCPIHVAIPGVDPALHVCRRTVGRPAERMIGEVDFIARERARKARPHMLPQPVLIPGGCGHRSAPGRAPPRAICAGTRRRPSRRCRA